MIREVDGALYLNIHHVGGTKETMPVEVITPNGISIRWRQSGIYNLNLQSGRLFAASLASRRKNPCWWYADDIEQVRRWHWDKYHPVKEVQEREALFRRHVENMPYQIMPRIKKT